MQEDFSIMQSQTDMQQHKHVRLLENLQNQTPVDIDGRNLFAGEVMIHGRALGLHCIKLTFEMLYRRQKQGYGKPYSLNKLLADFMLIKNFFLNSSSCVRAGVCVQNFLQTSEILQLQDWQVNSMFSLIIHSYLISISYKILV